MATETLCSDEDDLFSRQRMEMPQIISLNTLFVFIKRCVRACVGEL